MQGKLIKRLVGTGQKCLALIIVAVMLFTPLSVFATDDAVPEDINTVDSHSDGKNAADISGIENEDTSGKPENTANTFEADTDNTTSEPVPVETVTEKQDKDSNSKEIPATETTSNNACIKKNMETDNDPSDTPIETKDEGSGSEEITTTQTITDKEETTVSTEESEYIATPENSTANGGDDNENSPDVEANDEYEVKIIEVFSGKIISRGSFTVY